jgi:catechol 2,3-dioxygenase-like lactoylglutathione lyase family enzyme
MTTYGTMYYVDDMQKAVSFYNKTLGVEPAYASEDWTEFDFTGHKLCLHSKRAGEKYDPNGVLIINQKNIKDLFSKMKADGFNVFGLHEVHPKAWTFHMKDVSNNELSFYGEP